METMKEKNRPEGYERPKIRRHAVIMTMTPVGYKMGHGLFPFQTKKTDVADGAADGGSKFVYRRA